MEKLLNALFPAKCLFCRSGEGIFCRKCLEKCWIVEKDHCVVCDKFSLDGKTHKRCATEHTPDSVFSCFLYSGVVKKCLNMSKFGQKQFYALKILVKEGIDHAKACGKQYDDFVVVPVPISKERFKSRGFNQAELIAKALSKAFNLKMENSILIRQKSTEYQFTKNRAERFDNLKGVFSACGTRARGKSILLVDDLTTTGATLLEASKILYLTGAKEVHGFILCKRERFSANPQSSGVIG